MWLCACCSPHSGQTIHWIHLWATWKHKKCLLFSFIEDLLLSVSVIVGSHACNWLAINPLFDIFSCWANQRCYWHRKTSGLTAIGVKEVKNLWKPFKSLSWMMPEKKLKCYNQKYSFWLVIFDTTTSILMLFVHFKLENMSCMSIKVSQ